MAPPFPEPGDIFERQYRIEAKAGRGGFARIYRAIQQHLERDVALKILKPQPYDDLEAHHLDEFESQVVQRFHREARNVAQLRDPHTVTLYDYGQTPGGLFYMVFEFVDGKTLKFAADHNQPIDQERVVDILQKVLSSLEEAHTLGMLHRDIKPANIMIYDYIGRTDQVKVLDFGISKAVLHNASVTLKNLTREHVMMGTPRYMSPEQLRGDRIGPPSDLYSLGLVAYELLVGRQAIEDDHEADIINRQINPKPITLPDEVNVTDTLRATLHRMLAKEQQDRFQSTDELREALAAWNSPRGFPWEKEWLDPSFEPAARDETTDIEQIDFPIDGGGTHQPIPTRRDDLDTTHRPIPTRRNGESTAFYGDDGGTLFSARGNLAALLIGVFSTLAVVGLVWVFWSPWENDEPVDLTASPSGTEAVDLRESNAARPATGRELTIRTRPSGATIRIDGRLVGNSPLTLPHEKLEYPLIVHAERSDGTRLAQKVSYPTETITLDFSVVTPAPDAGTADVDTDAGDAGADESVAAASNDRGSESTTDPDSPPDDEATAPERREDETSDDESSDHASADRESHRPHASDSTVPESDDNPKVIPLLDQNTEKSSAGGTNPSDDEIGEDDDGDGSGPSPTEHEFPPLDQ